MKPLIIDGRKIGDSYPPYIIAEMSANHNGSLDQAFKILEMAKFSGADAIKMQTYTADTITMNCKKPDFRISGGLWDGRTLYDLYQEAHTPWEWHEPLFEKARELGVTIFSSPFDSSAVDLLEELNAPAYKIASFECIDLPLIKYVAQTGKPMIISTGMANMVEISEAITTARDNGCEDLVVLHCVSAYPASAEEYNLKTLTDMKKRFGCLVGLSDHTLDNTTAITSVALGACVIEKHVTLSRDDGGVDSSFSLEPSELAQLVNDSQNAHLALGEVTYVKGDMETSFKKYRRSLFVVKDLPKGHMLTANDVAALRPGDGLAPKYKNDVLGRTLGEDVNRGTPVAWDLLA